MCEAEDDERGCQERKEEEHDDAPGMGCDAGDESVVPCGEEELRERGNAVLCLGVGEGQVLLGVGVGGVEPEGTLVAEDGIGETVETVVGVAEVVVEVGGGESVGNHLVVLLHRGGVVALAVAFVGSGGCFLHLAVGGGMERGSQQEGYGDDDEFSHN